MVDIANTSQLKTSLTKLKADALPLFGKMSPQHVIEHLTKSLKVSSGQIPVKLYLSPEDANALKQKMIYSDYVITPGIKSPIMGDEPPELINKNLEEALSELHSEIENFHTYYKNNPLAVQNQPRMGELNFNEWLTFHNKHFTHHFKQYNLL